MLTMNVFAQDAFSAIQLSAAVDKIDYVPQYLSAVPGLFVPDPVRTEAIWIEERTTGALILPFSPRGAPPHQTGGDKRKARAFRTLRFGDASRITASELLAIRAWNSEVALKDLQTEIARRQFKIKQNMQLTKEFHLLNCVTQAKVLDADATLMYDWAVEFEQSIPGEINFDLSNTGRHVRKLCADVRRSIQRNLKGVGVARDVIGLCGDNFWNDLTSNAEVVQTYLNWSAASDLRGPLGREWGEFRYGDVTFVNYRSTDDGTTVGIPTDKCKFFPVGADIFRLAYSPGERFEHLGQLGQETYSAMVLDDDRNSWADVEVYSYPLPVCIMPQALYQARRT